MTLRFPDGLTPARMTLPIPTRYSAPARIAYAIHG